ncbi:cytochrome c oxidase assembly protein [Nitrosococcus oceani]|uniref:Cytochrome c oxidase assembly protein CtaG n=2 Tax=Nitrosococcus oceani TaxID=1229 RepID=Q3J6R0_NITOC|nr:Cytochrome c oxidase assembly protein CtaG/Cox11 [Nitrosococcus oceani ATCC 19707]EDZ65597.1 Cytochrome c oxidase assembly protein CtaG / Cox11 [Nitrosococcus oceani AFC27]GEM21387.1 cytochrome c oxidase assembly protein [Nitrosococcus oceani]
MVDCGYSIGYLYIIHISECDKMNTTEREATNHRLVAKLALMVVAMFGFGYAMVPLYDVICEIAGLNGKPENVAVSVSEAGAIDTSRTITVQFLASVNSQLSWEFKPEVQEIRVHPGEVAKVTYYASNLNDHSVIGQAIPSVSPGLAAKHLHKTECFCFTEQTLQAGETREMPVVFFVDPKLPQNYSEMTLSYTFFDVSDRASTQIATPSG